MKDYYDLPGIGEVKDVQRAATTHEGYCEHCRLTTLKYVIRAGRKGKALPDVQKAIDYLTYWKAELIRQEKIDRNVEAKIDEKPDGWEDIDPDDIRDINKAIGEAGDEPPKCIWPRVKTDENGHLVMETFPYSGDFHRVMGRQNDGEKD